MARLSPTPSQTDSDEPDSPPPPRPTSRGWKLSTRSTSAPKDLEDLKEVSYEADYHTAIASASAVSLAADPKEEVDILSREVAALSTKLILAVDRQADLEDALVACKHELELSQNRVAELEQAERDYSDRLEKGLLVHRKDVEHETSTLMKKLMEESRARLKAESDRRSIEQELEDLTGSLFDEANKMVAGAMRRQDSLEHKNKQLENIIHEKDNLLVSLQEQLTALKVVLQDVTDAESHSQPTSPQSPSDRETPLSASSNDSTDDNRKTSQ
ncbi:uncharacterized protein V2V93DRAFT_367589 [Kockiozyma suomiensis]|uniref:uncharacterized protein n=1 Tax=Kockiozyma suomiensis TaxID=1337062 RepID=UPI00334311C8